MSFKPAARRRLLTVGLVALALAGCGYGEVSPSAYEYAKALYGVANRKAADRLDGVVEQISVAEASGEITAREADWLGDIIDHARDGDWDRATERARRMMEDQVS